MTPRRNTLWLVVLGLLILLSGWFAAMHPNRALAECNFIWYLVRRKWLLALPNKSEHNG
jgi:hypothetical protein